MQKWYFQSGRLYLRNNEHVYLISTFNWDVNPENHPLLMRT